MGKDLTVVLEDRPGTLAELGETLGKAGINIEGFCGLPCQGKGIIHILVEDAAAARRALEDVGLEVGSEREVLLLEAEDRPGMLGGVARKMASSGVNIDFIYKATRTKLVIGVDDLEKGQAAVS
jgi:hypothetical protein